MIKVEGLFPFKDYYDGKINTSVTVPTKEEFDNILKKFSLKAENFYLSNGIKEPFLYWDGDLLIFSLHSMDFSYLKDLQLRKLPKREALLSQGYLQYFISQPVEFRYFLLNQIESELDDSTLYSIVEQCFTSEILSFTELPQNVVRRLSNSLEVARKVKNSFNTEEKISAYIGIPKHTQIMNPKIANLSIGNALRHSFIDDVVGDIYRLSVKPSNVLFLNQSTGLIYLKENFDTELADMIEFDDKKTEIMSVYNRYKEQLMMYASQGIHGAQHVANTLVLGHLILKEEKVSKEDRDIIMKSLLYHDVGRVNDFIDDSHGAMSYQYYCETGMEPNPYIEYIVTNHCIDDSTAFKNVKNYNVDKEKAIKLLSIVKDADNLDRFRLGDFKEKYLRNESSRKMIKIAFCLNLN